MTDLAYEIESLYIEGHSVRSIAQMLECPVSDVVEWIAEQNIKEPMEDFD